MPVPLVLSPVVFAVDEQITTVGTAPQAVLELDIPAAASVMNGEEMRLATPRINLSESLTGVPGLQVQNRRNYMQDLQLSIRGFGSCSTCGIRGIRLYANGIPVIVPNGQGRTSNIDLSSVQNVEVPRDPSSALYDNASDGVANVTAQTGQQPPTIEASSYYGSLGNWRCGLKVAGTTGDGTQPDDADYTVPIARSMTYGYRDHSDAQRSLADTKLGICTDDVNKSSLIFSNVNIRADNPGGLIEAEWKMNSQ